MFWDENDQLIVSNKRNQEIMKQAGIDFVLEKGIKYEQMLKKNKLTVICIFYPKVFQNQNILKKDLRKSRIKIKNKRN